MKVLNSKVKPESAIPLKSGTMIQQYRLTRVLGIGGFSVVYCAEDTKTGDVVAIKEFYSTSCMRRRKDGSLGVYPVENKAKYQFGIKRFFDEGFVLSQMDHQNIVKVCNFFRYNNTAYLVMDFQRGKDLRWFIKNTDIMPDETFLLTVFTMVLAGVKEMHNKGFLHLDIKPSNILLRTNGFPLLLDLGAAFLLDEKKVPKLQTLTHGYSSPEQHERKPLSFASDLYSVAMAMRACITHATPQSAAKRVTKDFVQPLIETHANRFRINFLRTIDAASELDPAKRPQDVDEFVSGLTSR